MTNERGITENLTDKSDYVPNMLASCVIKILFLSQQTDSKQS